MGTQAKRVSRIVALWLAVGALLVAALVNLDTKETTAASGPRSLGEIELLATMTTFDEQPTFHGGISQNPLRGNFTGSLFSTDSACMASRLILFFRVSAGSLDDVLVAASVSDNAGTTGNFTSTEFHDPPMVPDTYYAVVQPDEDKDCEGVTSDPVVVN